MEGYREDGAKIFTVCVAERGEIIDTNCIKGNSERKKIFTVKWSNTAAGGPEKLQSLHLWRY